MLQPSSFMLFRADVAKQDGLTAGERAERRKEFRGLFSPEYQPAEYRGGRVSSVKRYAGIISDSERVIADRLPDILYNLLLLGTGQATEEVVTPKGEVIERRLPPSEKALMYLYDRLAGKPINVTQMEVSGEVKHTGVTIHLVPQGPPTPPSHPDAIEAPATLALPVPTETLARFPLREVKDVRRQGRRKKPRVVTEATGQERPQDR